MGRQRAGLCDLRHPGTGRQRRQTFAISGPSTGVMTPGGWGERTGLSAPETSRRPRGLPRLSLTGWERLYGTEWRPMATDPSDPPTPLDPPPAPGLLFIYE